MDVAVISGGHGGYAAIEPIEDVVSGAVINAKHAA